jgi:hypothetical protein
MMCKVVNIQKLINANLTEAEKQAETFSQSNSKLMIVIMQPDNEESLYLGIENTMLALRELNDGPTGMKKIQVPPQWKEITNEHPANQDRSPASIQHCSRIHQHTFSQQANNNFPHLKMKELT